VKVVQSVVGEFRKTQERTCAAEELSPLKGSAQGRPDASLDVEHRPHVEPGTPGNVLRPLLRSDELIEKMRRQVETLQTLAQEFFKTESVAVTALGNLNGMKLTPITRPA